MWMDRHTQTLSPPPRPPRRVVVHEMELVHLCDLYPCWIQLFALSGARMRQNRRRRPLLLRCFLFRFPCILRRYDSSKQKVLGQTISRPVVHIRIDKLTYHYLPILPLSRHLRIPLRRMSHLRLNEMVSCVPLTRKGSTRSAMASALPWLLMSTASLPCFVRCLSVSARLQLFKTRRPWMGQ